MSCYHHFEKVVCLLTCHSHSRLKPHLGRKYVSGKRHVRLIRFLALSVGLAVAATCIGPAQAQTIQKASTGTDLGAGASWIGGAAPGSANTGLFDNLAGPANTTFTIG